MITVSSRRRVINDRDLQIVKPTLVAAEEAAVEVTCITTVKDDVKAASM